MIRRIVYGVGTRGALSVTAKVRPPEPFEESRNGGGDEILRLRPRDDGSLHRNGGLVLEGDEALESVVVGFREAIPNAAA